MATGVARYIQHLPCKAQCMHHIPLGYASARLRHCFLRGAVNLRPGLPAKFCHATNVVGMVVCQQNSLQLQAVCLQCAQRRTGVAGVHDQGVTAIVQKPDVVIIERSNAPEVGVFGSSWCLKL